MVRATYNVIQYVLLEVHINFAHCYIHASILDLLCRNDIIYPMYPVV